MEMEDLNNNNNNNNSSIDNNEIEFLTPQLVLSPNLEDNNNNNDDEDDLVEVPETPMTQERDQNRKKKEPMIIICNGNNCTLSIAECNLLSYDSHGNFYCPPCYYKSAIAELDKLQKEMLLAKHNVHLARNSLSLFLNAIPPQPPANNPIQKVTEKCNVIVRREEHNVGEENVVSTGSVNNNEKRSSVNVAAEVGVSNDLPLGRRTRTGKAKQVECQQHKSVEDSDEDFSLLDGVFGQPSDLPLGRRTPSGKAKQVECQQHKSVEDSHEDFALLDGVFGQPQLEDREMVQNTQSNVGCVRRSSLPRRDDKSDPFTRYRFQKSVVQEEDFELQEIGSVEESTRSDETAPHGDKPEVVSGNFSRQYKVVKRSTNPGLLDSRRKPLVWTYEEEEMIMQGVRIFSQRGKQNLPWKSVLVHGAKIFDASRTPSDLKDKWKRMVKQASRPK